MKNILLMLLTLNHLYASFLVVNDTPGVIQNSPKEVQLYPLTINFSNLKVSTLNNFIEIPIYVKSDTTEAVYLTLQNITPLKQGIETIPLSFSYRDISIDSDTPFLLLNAGEGRRDGNTIIGKIKVKIPTILSTQLHGNYSTNISINLSSKIHPKGSNSNLDITANILLVAIAGFRPVNNFTQGKNFLNTVIQYNNLILNKKNTIEESLYIKSNSLQSFNISFNTSELKHTIDEHYHIPLKYYYNNILFTNNTFHATQGKNDGSKKIGILKFETDNISSNILSGRYQAIIEVTITLE